MKAIIFGASGQDGYYLTKLLQEQQITVIGISRNGTGVKGDVANFQFVEACFQLHRPDYVFHFAATSTTSHEALFENHEAISSGTWNILESAKRHCPHAKFFLSGSAMQFLNSGVPIDEQTPFAASSPYSVSRIQSVYAGRYYREKFGLPVFVGYLFNHDSPLRTQRHINQKIIQAARQISQGARLTLEIGDVTVQKEFNFAGDIVSAIWRLVNQSSVYEAMIGSGQAFALSEWLELCFSFYKADWRRFVVPIPGFVAEYQVLVSQPRLIKSLGWTPKTSIVDLAQMMWRHSPGSGPGAD